MAKPAKPATAKKEEVVAAAPKSKKKLIIIAVAASLIAGGAGWYFMKGKNAEHAEAPKVEAPKEPTFIPLEAFTVNLQREESDQYLQINITLKTMEPALTETIKAVLPEVRSKLNLLLSSKRPSELASAEGKKKLAAEIVAETNNVLGIHNTPAVHAPVPASAPVAEVAAESAVEAASAPAEGGTPTAEAAAGEAASAPVAPAPAAPVVAEKKGIVDVLFTSFIIQ